MAFKNVVQLTPQQYNTLKNGGTVGSQTGLDPDNLYCVNSVVVVEEAGNSANGYRIWSDGYVEQWGTLTQGAAYNSTTQNVTFTIPFDTTSGYQYVMLATATSGGNYVDGAWVTSMQSTGAIVKTGSQVTTGSTRLKCNWYARGKRATS